MQDLIAQEKFELEVLDLMNTARLLNRLVFGGGTMLRLCYGLDRYSVDLDFWMTPQSGEGFFDALKAALEKQYAVKDAADKFYTYLVEVRSPRYPRGLKIEVRKDKQGFASVQAIAYSRHAVTQVLLNTVALPDMMRSKCAAFLDRREIRDAFDIEFLLKKGIALDIDAARAANMLKVLDALPQKDYTVKLGSLLEPAQRGYYSRQNFRILKDALNACR